MELLVNKEGTLESWREKMLREREKGALGQVGRGGHHITTGDGDRVDSSAAPWEHINILTAP